MSEDKDQYSFLWGKGEQSTQREAREKFEGKWDAASQKYEVRVDKAKKGILRRLLSPGTVAKTVGMFGLDAHSIVTGYSVGDIVAAYHGVLDIIAARTQQDRSEEEKQRLVARGAFKIGAAVIPFVPASTIAPSIDAVSQVDRDQPKKK